MLEHSDCDHLAKCLIHKHGKAAHAYALKNASALRAANSELEAAWLRVAKKIENLITATSGHCRTSDA